MKNDNLNEIEEVKKKFKRGQFMPRLTGSNIIQLGEQWREIFLKGKSVIQISDEFHRPSQVVSRAIWLGSWPQRLKELVFAHPEVFTMDKLINGFASKRRQCEKDNFAILEREIKRMLEAGSGSRPKLRKTNKKPSPVPGTKASPLFHIDKSLEASFRIKQALSLHSNVAFEESGAGEVRIFFKNEKDLDFILERLEDIRFNSKKPNTINNDNFLGFLE